MKRATLGLLLALALVASPVFSANLIVLNFDGPNEGFNDPTPAAPVGGNPGTTVGQQRLNAFNHAAAIWGATLESPQDIYIAAQFNPLTCSATSGVLGSAGTTHAVRDFPGAELAGTWYHAALADKLADTDFNPAIVDLSAQFNSSLGIGTCLVGSGWYYGLDPNEPANRQNLVAVILHEFAHGLGFSNFFSVTTGNSSLPGTFAAVYGEYAYSVTQGKNWNTMTPAQRVAATVDSRRVVWTGLNANTDAQSTLAAGTPLLVVVSPASIAGVRELGTASFGAALTPGGVTGVVVAATDAADAAGPTVNDACSAIDNAGTVAGNIALVDRGTCGFAIKVKNAQNAGAIAVIVADNVAGGPPPGMSGVDPTITIPSGRVTLADGNALRANPGAVVTLEVDPAVLAGTEATTGLLHLNAPNPVQPGSSISHWDPIAFPNQLMEPAINADLTHSVLAPQDLTTAQLTDLGWFSDGDGVPDGSDACIGSDPSATVVVDGCDSGAPNVTFADGCKISDQLEDLAAGARNHGDFVSGVTQLTNDLRRAGVIDNNHKAAIQACAAQAAIP